MDNPERVAIGKLGRPHGIRGEIRLFLFNPQSQAIRPGLDAQVRLPDDSTRQVTVVQARYAKKFVILKLENVQGREDADALKHGELELHYDDLPELDDDQFYYIELLNAPVFEAGAEDQIELPDDAQPLGTVDRFFETGANDVLVVDRGDDGELFVPLVEHAIALMDLENYQVILQPLDLWTAPETDGSL